MPRPTLHGVSVTVDLPSEVVARLRAEAARRGVTIEVVIAELADQLPTAMDSTRSTLAFVAAGASAGGITSHMEQSLADGFGRD